MSVTINYKNSLSKTNSFNLIMFLDENFNISPLKKHISSYEHNFIKDLIKTMDNKKKILSFEIIAKLNPIFFELAIPELALAISNAF